MSVEFDPFDDVSLEAQPVSAREIARLRGLCDTTLPSAAIQSLYLRWLRKAHLHFARREQGRLA